LPLQQVRQQDGHAAREFALFALAHVFDLPGDVFDVEHLEAPGTQQPSLLLGPGVDVFVVVARQDRLLV
jgi:hypothetical protein